MLNHDHDHDVNILNIIFQGVYAEFMIIVTVINGIKVSMFFIYKLMSHCSTSRLYFP